VAQRHLPLPVLETNDSSKVQWASLEPSDPQKFIINLRAIGCPEQTIRDLITFRICREYRKRLIEVETGFLIPLGYTKSLHALSHKQRSVEERELRQSMDKELETLLGVSAAKLKMSLVGRQIPDSDFLPPEKKRLVRELNERYGRLIEEASQGLSGFDFDPQVDARVKELNQQKEVELAKLLTARELEESRLRSSPAAYYVLENLPEASSETEFRQMVKVVNEIGIAEPQSAQNRYRLPFLLPGVSSNAPNRDRELADKQAQLEVRLEQELGSDRYTEMKLAEKKRLSEIDTLQ